MMAECSRSLGLSQLCFSARGSRVSTKHLLLTPAQQYKVQHARATITGIRTLIQNTGRHATMLHACRASLVTMLHQHHDSISTHMSCKCAFHYRNCCISHQKAQIYTDIVGCCRHVSPPDNAGKISVL